MQKYRLVTRLLLPLILLYSALPLLSDSELQPIRIGATLSFSGRYRDTSLMIDAAYRLWSEQVNRGGGILGRPVELLISDDRSDPETAAKEYRRLMDEEEVDLVLSPYSTPITQAVATETEKRGYPMITAGAASEFLWQQGRRYLFGMYALADRFFIGYLDLMAREGLTDIVILHEENTFNLEAAGGVEEWADRFGLVIRDRIVLQEDPKLLEKIVVRLSRELPDGIVVSSYPDIGYRLLEAFNRMSFKPSNLAMAILPVFPEFYERAGSMAEGVFGPSQWEPMEQIPYPGTKQFINDFIEFTGEQPAYHAGSAYGLCQIIEQAIIAAGSIDREAIRNYIATLDTVTVIGRFKVDGTGRQIGHNPILIQWQDGRKEIVYPRAMSTAEPRFGH